MADQNDTGFFFMQLADPQIGLFEVREGRPPDGVRYVETALYEKTIAAANRLRPDFVVVCGDLVQRWDDLSQQNEFRRISDMLSSNIPLRLAAGNCDVGVTPTPVQIDAFRDRHGKDYYHFDHKGTRFIVLNSAIWFDPSLIPGEWEQQLGYLREALQGTRDNGNRHAVVFSHHPLFVERSDEEDSSNSIPGERRRPVLDLLMEYGVSHQFAGHLHKNAYASHEGFSVVASGPVGYPLGEEPSGLRIVKVSGERIEHSYFGLDDVPDSIGLS